MSRIHEFSSLSNEKKSNVVNSFQWRKEYGNVMFAIDNTVFGSCKDGVVVTEGYLLVREAFSDPTRVEWDRVQEIACVNGHLRINGRNVFKFSIPDNRELQEFFADLHESLAAPDDAEGAQQQESSTTIANPSSQDAAFLAELKQAVAEMSRRRLDADGVREHASINFFIKIIEASQRFERRFAGPELRQYLDFATRNPLTKLATYTYVAAFIAAILEKEAGYSLDASERYYQYPFFLIYKTNSEDPAASKRTISAIASMGNGLKDNEAFKRCDFQFGFFVQSLRLGGSCAEQYLKLLNDLVLQGLSPTDFKAFYGIFDDRAANQLVDKYLQLLEDEISDAVVDIFEVYSRSNGYPTLFPNVGLPMKLFFGMSEDAVRPRVWNNR